MSRGAPPPELLSLGVVEEQKAPAVSASVPETAPVVQMEEAPAKKTRGTRGGGRPAKKGKAPSSTAAEKTTPAAASPAAAARPAAKKSRGPRGAAKKSVAKTATA